MFYVTHDAFVDLHLENWHVELVWISLREYSVVSQRPSVRYAAAVKNLVNGETYFYLLNYLAGSTRVARVQELFHLCFTPFSASNSTSVFITV